MRKPASFIVTSAVFLPLCLCTCATLPKVAPARPGPDASRLLASVKQYNNDLESFRGIGKLRIMGKVQGQTTRVVWIGSQLGKLRVETLGVWGQPTLTFLVNGSTFYLHTCRNNRYFKGKATARNISRFVSIPIRAEALFSLLSGQPPVLPFHYAKIRALEGEGQWLLSLYKKWRRLIEKMWLKDDGKTVERVEVFDGWGNLKYTVAFNRFEEVEGFRIPYEIMISHAQRPVLSLKVERFWINVPIPAGAYTLELSDAHVVDLD